MPPSLVVTHCGSGSGPDLADGAERAGRAALAILERGGRAIDAVTEAIVILEDDPRTNAGTGSRLRLDGRAQMDASIMTDDLEAGAVAAIEDVKNPILVARKVMDTPHVLLVGRDATKFARKAGFRYHDPITPESRERWRDSIRRIKTGDLPPYAEKWRDFGGLTGTVGAVARDSSGGLCTGSSTGGTAFMMAGRVGDTPILGSGIYCGSEAAVSATGVGEEIVKRVLAKAVYDRIAAGKKPQAACEEALKAFKKSVPVGVIAVGADGVGEACNREMSWWANAPPRAR